MSSQASGSRGEGYSPKEQGHNKNIFRKTSLRDMNINKTVPNRRDLHHRKEFHWFNQFGSKIYEAEHQNSINYIDIEGVDEMNRLCYYSPTGQ
ncbi:hypothetical protein Tco_1169967, partial [Tanacetum coccineum]